MSVKLEAGAANCVVNCAGARRGIRLFVVNEIGSVDEAVADTIAAAAQDSGALVESLWVDPIPKLAPDKIPEKVLNAYREGDVVISHIPSLTRESLHSHFPSETRVRVPNRARTVALLSSDWARFPYLVQCTIAKRLEEKMTPGRGWRITSPAGTDVKGLFGTAGGEVGAAFFVQGQQGRARKNFPGGVHDPRGCAELDGVIAVEYMDYVDQKQDDLPPRIEVKDCRITDITGGAGDGKLRAAIAASDGWIDSWHAGVNPRTVSPVNRHENGRSWFGYSHCSPAIMHYHLGRGHKTTNLASFCHSLSVDGELLYADGALCPAILGDAVVEAEIKASGMDYNMLESKAIALW